MAKNLMNPSPAPGNASGVGNGEPNGPGITAASAPTMGRARDTGGGTNDMPWLEKTQARTNMDTQNSRYGTSE